MRVFQIRSHQNADVLFEGKFVSFQACMEHAVVAKIDLSYADLRNINLSNANLDDAHLPYADLSNTNLSGANLSESTLSGARFDLASLYNTCLAYSDLQECHFEYTAFGGTDITGANLACSLFSGLSCFTLDFIHAAQMDGCQFKNQNGIVTAMSRPPIVIQGLQNSPLVFMDRFIKSGALLLPYHEWPLAFETDADSLSRRRAG